MGAGTKPLLDTILKHTTGRAGGVPGVVAMATDRSGNFYEGAAGVRQMGVDTPMTTDSVFCLFSTTKALTGVALMQLVEEGAVSLDDPVRQYVPEIADIGVIDGFDPDGQPRLRPPKTDITLNHLMLHTAGFAYEFFSDVDLKYRTTLEIPSVIACNFASVRTALVHDPGQQWTYGCNIDWVGKTVEAVRGKRLGEVFADRIYAPLGMVDIAFTMTPSMHDRRVSVHMRAADGQLTAAPGVALPQPPEMDMGGHGLYATVGEYMKFIRMILNDGDGPNGRVLQPATVQAMSRNGLGDLEAGGWPTTIPTLTNEGEFFPGVRKGWAYTFMTNEEEAPTGRPAGALAWAGLGNLFYWIDRQNGLGGFWASQILPFQDCASYPGYIEFETAIYRSHS